MVSFMDPETLQRVGWVCRTAHPWVQGNGGGNHLKKGKGFLLSFVFLLCDFYQNTEIQHTHKPAQKRSALFTAPAGTCPPGQPPAEGVGRRGQPRQQGKEMRQEKTEGKQGRSRETKRREVEPGQ